MTAPAACVVCASNRVERVAGPAARWVYRRCDSCGHMWLHPTPTTAELAAYYNGAYTVPRERYVQRARDAYPSVRGQLAIAGARTGSMLEVGCSYGEMLAGFQRDGWAVTGVELDARACAEAGARLGARVHCGTLDDFHPDRGTQFDIVTAFHVLEHVVQPAAFARRALALLRPGGVLMLKTPNAASVAARAAAGWWEWAAPPEHVNLFSPASLRSMLASAGATDVVISSRRGDANGLLFELARSTAKRLAGRPAGGGSYGPGETPVSHRAWYRAVRRADAVLGAPLDLLMASGSSGDRQLGAELTVMARQGNR